MQFSPDWFVTQQLVNLWHDEGDYCDNDRLIKCFEGYTKRKAKKAQIKEKLLPIAWHGGIGVFLRTRKKRQKNYGGSCFRSSDMVSLKMY